MHKIKILFKSSLLFYALLLIMPSSLTPSAPLGQPILKNNIGIIQANLQNRFDTILLKETIINNNLLQSAIQRWVAYVFQHVIPFIDHKNKIRLAGENKLLKKAVEMTAIVAQSLNKIINPHIDQNIKQGFLTSLINSVPELAHQRNILNNERFMIKDRQEAKKIALDLYDKQITIIQHIKIVNLQQKAKSQKIEAARQAEAAKAREIAIKERQAQAEAAKARARQAIETQEAKTHEINVKRALEAQARAEEERKQARFAKKEQARARSQEEEQEIKKVEARTLARRARQTAAQEEQRAVTPISQAQEETAIERQRQTAATQEIEQQIITQQPIIPPTSAIILPVQPTIPPAPPIAPPAPKAPPLPALISEQRHENIQQAARDARARRIAAEERASEQARQAAAQAEEEARLEAEAQARQAAEESRRKIESERRQAAVGKITQAQQAAAEEKAAEAARKAEEEREREEKREKQKEARRLARAQREKEEAEAAERAKEERERKKREREKAEEEKQAERAERARRLAEEKARREEEKVARQLEAEHSKLKRTFTNQQQATRGHQIAISELETKATNLGITIAQLEQEKRELKNRKEELMQEFTDLEEIEALQETFEEENRELETRIESAKREQYASTDQLAEKQAILNRAIKRQTEIKQKMDTILNQIKEKRELGEQIAKKQKLEDIEKGQKQLKTQLHLELKEWAGAE